MIFLKTLFKHSLSLADLHKLAAKNLAHPPLPKELYDASASLVGKKGISLLDYWRTGFSTLIDEIASEKTWELQRAKLLGTILTEQGWSAATVASRETKFTDAWSHMVENVDHFKNSPKDVWPSLLFQRYIVALLTVACLIELGAKAFQLDDLKQNELGLHGEIEKEIRLLDVQFSNQMLLSAENFEDDLAETICAMKEDVINPLIKEQFDLLSVMREQIVHSNLDIVEVKKRIDAFDARTLEIAASLKM
jgi:hypothetical protein